MKSITIPDDARERFRNAATKFTRDASPRGSRLLSVKDDIAALRKKGASFRTIGELLTQNGIAASDTCVMRFCHSELGEKSVRGTKRRSSAAPKPARATNGNTASPTTMSEEAQAVLLDNLLSAVPEGLSPKPANENGPRIARIEFAKPGEL